MKKILGLDLGSSSIGWAFIEESAEKSIIKKMGVRIIPYSGDENDKFLKGQAITTSKDRTLKRSARKNQQRYKQRKFKLTQKLASLNMMPSQDELIKLSPLVLYGLRSKAVSERIELTELGRVFFLLNQKRGYRVNRFTNNDEEGGKKMSDYLTEMKDRKEMLEVEHLTIGQFFYKKLQGDKHYRVKQNVFPRECYIDEFNAICTTQRQFYPNILTQENCKFLRDEVIYFQRNLKSQKALVSDCTFEKNHKATPKSSPLFQVEKIWESIHNISLTNKHNELFEISLEKKQEIFDCLNNEDKLTSKKLFGILGLKMTSGWSANDQIKKVGIQGNTTKSTFLKVFRSLNIDPEPHVQFNLKTVDLVNKDTGEILPNAQIDDSFEKEPLYRLWHVIYSIDDPVLLVNVLQRNFGFTEEQAQALNKIDFKKQGFGNKSARAIRKLLPQLMAGFDYTRAADKVGYNHSASITKEQNEQRELQAQLSLYKRNSLRQPVVEKVMNQLVNVVNAILVQEELGRPDEIRVELARELRQSKDERERAYKMGNDRNREHQQIYERLTSEFPGLAVTGKVIEKYKLFEQQDGTCMYSGKKMELSMVLKGEGIDVDHVIPQSKLFDDSFQNKVLVYRKLNQDKNNQTAIDFIKGQSNEAVDAFVERVNQLSENGNITRSKRNKLLMSEADIPDDFISRQLNETRYISKEATKLLKQICRNVYSTSGSVTEFLRNEWGYNEVLKQLNYTKYEKAGLASDGKIDKDKWSKRDDHRHHSIDALIVAATTQSFIQKLNTLNSSKTRQELIDGINGKVNPGWQQRKSSLQQFTQLQRPFAIDEVKDAVSAIIVSIKSGKKVAVTSTKNKKNNQVTLVPRGQLHKETVYGKIRKYAAEKTPLNGRFKIEFLQRIANPIEQQLVKERLELHSNDPKKAFKDLAKFPIWVNQAQEQQLTAVTLWEEHYVVKYKLDINFKAKDIEYIVDYRIRELVRERFVQHASSKDHPLKNLDNEPIWLDQSRGISIKSVRCFTDLNELVPLHYAKNGITANASKLSKSAKAVDFVSPRNNHHIAFYQTPEGEYKDLVVSFWEAVERKKLSIPVFVKDPSAVWDDVLNRGIDNQALLENLPKPDWEFKFSAGQNDYFLIDTELSDLSAVRQNDLGGVVSRKLYRIQKISKTTSLNIFLRHHLETRVDDLKNGGEMLAKSIGKLVIIQSIEALLKRNPIKVSIDYLGQIQAFS